MYCTDCGSEVVDEAVICPECGTDFGTDSDIVGGLEENVAGALAYSLMLLTGLVFFLVEEDNEFVRFHAAQSIVVFGSIMGAMVATTVLGIVFGQIPFLGFVMGLVLLVVDLVLYLGALVLWIVLMIKAFQGERYELPWAGDVASDWV